MIYTRGPFPAVCAVGLLLLAAGCKDTERTNADNISQPQTPAYVEPVDQAITDLDRNPQAFVVKIGSAHLYEIAAAQIALDLTRSNQIRDFARKMLTDHQQMNSKLREAAQGDTSLVIPTAPTEQQQADLAALKDAGNFDTRYFQQQRRAHEETLGVLRRFAMVGGPPALKEYSAQAAKQVALHHEMIRQIETETNPNALKEVSQR